MDAVKSQNLGGEFHLIQIIVLQFSDLDGSILGFVYAIKSLIKDFQVDTLGLLSNLCGGFAGFKPTPDPDTRAGTYLSSSFEWKQEKPSLKWWYNRSYNSVYRVGGRI